MTNSSLTFNDLFKTCSFIKVYWNGEKVFDDGDLEELNEFNRLYSDKIVYSAEIYVVEFHHCILRICGEESIVR